MSTMNETTKTVGVAIAAALCAVLTLATAPTRATPDTFVEIGDPFFPDFTDPNEATTLEVVEFDEETGAARPFQVTFRDNQWTIPSHHNYPADAADRLARTAAGVIDIVKDDVRSDNIADHEACGVIDPLDDTVTSLAGRGQRVTLRGENDRVLADFIVGDQVENRPGFRFVRVPGQKRIYAARMTVDLSTRFEDWIETDLLGVSQPDIDQLVLADYSIDERTQSIDERDLVTVTKVDTTWVGDDQIPEDRELDTVKVNSLLRSITSLSIVGVRPKPESVSPQLERTSAGLAMSPADMLSLQSRGYYFTRDGRLRSNEGELLVRTVDGIVYTLRFGEVLFGRGNSVTAGSEESDDAESGPGENRYLFITAELDRSLFPEPLPPSDTTFEEKAEGDWTDADYANQTLRDAHDQRSAAIAAGEERAAALQERIGAWYYVISSESFDEVSPDREALTKEKPAPPAAE